MYEQKTKENENSVYEFIENIEHPRKREDAYKLLEIYEETTGSPAKMWGTSIIGFGSYHYVYPTGHEGDAPYVGFSPRKAKISLYLMLSEDDREQLLSKLGKHTTGKACVYINKLDDIDLEVLKQLIQRSVACLQELYPNG